MFDYYFGFGLIYIAALLYLRVGVVAALCLLVLLVVWIVGVLTVVLLCVLI